MTIKTTTIKESKLRRQRAALFESCAKDEHELADDLATFSSPRKKKVKASAAGSSQKKPGSASSSGNFTLTDVTPMTGGQRQMFSAFKQGLNVIAEGAAGTGKTYIATYLALEKLLNGEVEKIIFLRSIVAARDIGFLPGTIWEKSEPYWSLYKDHVNEILGNGTAWDILFKKGMIEFETTSFMRGKTWGDSVIIMDEFQNCNRHEIFSALTRIGKNTQIVICGDHKQTDFKNKTESGWHYMKRLIERTDGIFDTVTFTNHDIVRSAFVKKIIIADSEIE